MVFENESDRYAVCPVCLERIYPDVERRRNARIPLTDDEQKCCLCNDVLLYPDKLFELVTRKINMLGVSFDRAVVACQIDDKNMIKTEKKVHKLAPYYGRNNLKNQIRYRLAGMIEEKLSKTVDFKNPEVVIMVKIRRKPFNNAPFDEVGGVNIFIDVNPLFIEGRYCKLRRGIPQTKWPCSKCKGKGCDECNHTGQQYENTVEGLISQHVLPVTRGSETRFHGSGREDIDVLMLGEGRPFVIEIKHPFNRKIDLKKLEDEINTKSGGLISVNNLKFTDKYRKGTIKNSSTESYKVYSAIAEFENGVTSNDVAAIEKLKFIDQRTPRRVEHRRADLIRQREIYNMKVERINSKKLRLIIKCQGGLYIKELISGDNGRTSPSISGITDNKAVCSQLDVLKVHIPG